MKLNILSKSVLVALSALGLTACGSDSDSNTVVQGPATLVIGTANNSTIADNKNIPIPNDLYIYKAIDDSRPVDPANWVLDSVSQVTHNFIGCGSNVNETKCSLTEIDGWSTTAPFSIPVTGNTDDIDIATLVEGVKLFKESTVDGDKTMIGALEEVTYRDTFEDVVIGEEAYTVRISDFGAIQILPLTPLSAETTYVVAVTSDLKTTDGESILTNGGYTDLVNPPAPPTVPTEESVYQQAFSTHQSVVESALNINNLLYSASFTTQSIGLELNSTGTLVEINVKTSGVGSNTGNYKLGDITNPGLILPDPTVCGANNIECITKASSSNTAKIEATLPYYFSENSVNGSNCSADVASFSNAKEWFAVNGANSHYESYLYTQNTCAGLFSSWGDATQIATQTQFADLNIIYPYGYNGTDPLPVAIFIHGITAVKELGNGGMLILDNFIQEYIADAGLEGHLVIAMDHHMHGSRAYDFNSDGVPEVTASASVRGLYPGNDNADVKNFLKADALLTSRDNFRQAVADVVNLRRTLSKATLTSIAIDDTDVKLIGHSMGAIVAATATGILNDTTESEYLVKNEVSKTVLANPGFGIGGVIFNSTWLGKDEVPPAIKLTEGFQLRLIEELAKAGVEVKQADLLAWAKANKADYDALIAKVEPAYMSEFQYLIQTVVDTVDPLNYVDTLSQSDILSITVDGSIQDGVKPSENYGIVTTGDQTVPVKVELDKHTMFERCQSLNSAEYGAQGRCALGTVDQPYYELNYTEFPLAGAYPLETLIGLENVLDNPTGTKVYTRTSVGTHNMGVGTLTETTAAAGNADFASVNKAAALVADQVANFIAGEDAANVVNSEIIK
jgi:pimeloyl-ACP methyl ester carboxylesterase